ncbi:excalibur calcium-binding domain-containing protein [Sphingomonas sp. RS2018]
MVRADCGVTQPPDTALPSPRPSAPRRRLPSAETAASSWSYRNCSDARRAGAAPLHRGTPGYGAHMDGDGDGIACEPYKGATR